MSKRSCIVALVGVNLFLLALLIVGTYSLPKAFAQRGGRGGGFACVTVKGAGQNYDIVYILDQGDRKLHAFRPKRTGPTVKYAPVDVRDLKSDFGS